jgi:hypothetical protein
MPRGSRTTCVVAVGAVVVAGGCALGSASHGERRQRRERGGSAMAQETKNRR